MYQQAGDRRGEAGTRANIARCYRAISAYPQAIEAAEEALVVHRDVGDRQVEAEIRALISTIHWDTAHYREAERQAAAALRIQQEIGERRGEAESLRCLATVRQMTGRPHRAVYAALQALNICHEIGDSSGMADTFDLLTRCYRSLSLLPMAERDAGRALETCRAIGDWRGEAEALDALARVERDIGERDADAGDLAAGQRWLDEAGAHARESRAIRERIGDLRGLGDALHTMATTERATWSLKRQGEHLDRSARHAELALEISRGSWHYLGNVCCLCPARCPPRARLAEMFVGGHAGRPDRLQAGR